MLTTCPNCGARLNNKSCQDIYHEFLDLEFSNPTFGKVHMITVACYMIQHGFYSKDALKWVAEKLSEHLYLNIPASKIQKIGKFETDQQNRKWKITQQSDKTQPKIVWSMTIIDIADNYTDAAAYCKLIEQWGKTVLEEMQPIINIK